MNLNRAWAKALEDGKDSPKTPVVMNDIRIKAMDWWSSLSLNEMKRLAAHHHPGLRFHTVATTPSFIEDCYRAEHGLEPQKRGAAFNQ